jgi:threonine synthase
METDINEPLVAYESMNAGDALKAFYDTNGRVYAFDDHELIQMYEELRNRVGVDALPASTASLLALLTYLKNLNMDGHLAISVITGGDRVG